MSTHPGERLREERLRLELTQEEFGAFGGVRKQAQIKYEKGDRKPDAAYFAGIAAAGANVDYILTGTPPALRANLHDIQTATELAQSLGGDQAKIVDNQSLIFGTLRKARATKADEEQLLVFYRRCSPEDQVQISKLAERLASVSPKPRKKRRPLEKGDE